VVQSISYAFTFLNCHLLHGGAILMSGVTTLSHQNLNYFHFKLCLANFENQILKLSRTDNSILNKLNQSGTVTPYN
jgi:hypothetical protein